MIPFTIEKKVPVPEVNYTCSEVKAVLLQMDIGDSFLVPDEDYKYVRSLASRLAVQYRRKYITRRVDELNFRIWRVERNSNN